MHKYGMLLKTFEEKRFKPPMLISPKIDGVRCIIINGKPYTRNGKEIYGIDHILEEVQLFGISELDGELCIPGQRFDKVSGLVRDHKQRPELQYHIFDAPSNDNIDFRLRTLSRAFMRHKVQHLEMVNHWLVNKLEDAHRLCGEFLVQGYEGAVIKTMNHKYVHKRSWHWMRMVPTFTEDLVCVDVFPGQGKHTGRAGGIVVDYNGKKVKVGTGFSDREREEIWAAPELFIGQIAEIKYKEITKAGSLRQPVFMHWRFDK